VWTSVCGPCRERDRGVLRLLTEGGGGGEDGDDVGAHHGVGAGERRGDGVGARRCDGVGARRCDDGCGDARRREKQKGKRRASEQVEATAHRRMPIGAGGGVRVTAAAAAGEKWLAFIDGGVRHDAHDTYQCGLRTRSVRCGMRPHRCSGRVT